MKLDHSSVEPIYYQIANWIEMEILAGLLLADEKVYSQYQLAEMFNINLATAGKGLTILLDAAIIYKKRGLGMFVSSGAAEVIRKKRVDKTLKKLVDELVRECKILGISEQELLEMIKAKAIGKE